MKKLKILIAGLLGSLLASVERLTAPRKSVALSNELGLFNEHGIETLQIDPAAALPIGAKYLVYERGAAYNYGRLAAGTNVPLGISSDSPYAIGDLFNVRRFGSKKGFELGIPGGAITQDHLVCVAKDGSGKLLDITLQGAGDYWVVGRCLKTVAATAIEFAFEPRIPVQITTAGVGGAYSYTAPV